MFAYVGRNQNLEDLKEPFVPTEPTSQLGTAQYKQASQALFLVSLCLRTDSLCQRPSGVMVLSVFLDLGVFGLCKGAGRGKGGSEKSEKGRRLTAPRDLGSCLTVRWGTYS